MTRFVLTYDPLIGKHRLDDPTKDITNRTRGRLEDDAAEWLAGLMYALDRRQTLTWIIENTSQVRIRDLALDMLQQTEAALKGDRHD